MNQVAFETKGEKIAILPQSMQGIFKIKSVIDNSVVYSDTISKATIWDYSNDIIRIADFTSLQISGMYYISVNNDKVRSTNFEIKNAASLSVFKSVAKGFYYWRASSAILPEYGKQWARPMGHPDTVVLVHTSAVSAYRPENTIIKCPRGWYDAGDYNKYIVNSGISTFTLLNLYEQFPATIDTINLNIPESKNNIPDLLDECLWNLRWMLTMQDFDGGVYHKCTTKKFSGMIMPSEDTNTRYVVQKGTAATLDFCAVMAVSARIFKKFNTQLPGFADSCKTASLNAWNWAVAHPNVIYTQPADIKTGGYGDSNFSDEFAWAGAELYILTLNKMFLKLGKSLDISASVSGWNNVGTLGLISLAKYCKQLNPNDVDIFNMKEQLVVLAEQLYEQYKTSSYKISLNHFLWGSNGDVANEAIMLLQGFYITGDKKYIEAARSDFDYLLGKNPLDLCYVTGLGRNSPLHPHDRRSVSDGVELPIPGYLVGGPNENHPKDCTNAFPITFPAQSYFDNEYSFSTNEIAINWNAPLLYLAGSLVALSDVESNSNDELLFIYSNQIKKEIGIVIPKINTKINVQICDVLGNQIINKIGITSNETYKLDLLNFTNGVYIIKVQTKMKYYIAKIVLE